MINNNNNNNNIEIMDGHPVPYSLTVTGTDDYNTILNKAKEYLKRYKPDMEVKNVDGNYVYY